MAALAERLRGRALAGLVAADRYHHLRTEIQARLDAGGTVVCVERRPGRRPLTGTNPDGDHW
ncbi:hypothetical protein AB0B21_28580 [Streptomyces rimosus]|uniref:hypothetical protein n=1 Tax=Streptomyces rimosus TaxID=1927 RepID=UPI000519D183|nr:hypothetical protein [Streptomyces rimosus]